MITINFLAENGIVSEGKVVRSKAATEYGSWFSDNVTPAELASWAEARIQTYQGWIENCKTLKKEAQKELLKDFEPAELEALLAAKRGERSEAQTFSQKPFVGLSLWGLPLFHKGIVDYEVQYRHR